MREIRIDNDGQIRVKNLSAYLIPEIKLEYETGGTVYTVSGSYEGSEVPGRKLERVLCKNMEEAV